MNQIIKELSKVTEASLYEINNHFDKGVLEILLELNKKNYLTIGSCEGHVDYKDKYCGFVTFKTDYFVNLYDIETPISADYIIYFNHKKQMIVWEGRGEESKTEALNRVLKWAKSLPPRERVPKYSYCVEKLVNGGKTHLSSEKNAITMMETSVKNLTKNILLCRTKYTEV